MNCSTLQWSVVLPEAGRLAERKNSWLYSRCWFEFFICLKAGFVHWLSTDTTKGNDNTGLGCSFYLKVPSSGQECTEDRNASRCQHRRLDPRCCGLSLEEQGLTLWRNMWGNVQLLVWEFLSRKLLLCNAVTVVSLLPCRGLKTQKANLEQSIILDASSESSNIPWKPKLPAERLLVANAYFMKSGAD